MCVTLCTWSPVLKYGRYDNLFIFSLPLSPLYPRNKWRKINKIAVYCKRHSAEKMNLNANGILYWFPVLI